MTSSQDTLVSIISVDNEDNLPLDSPASIVQNNQSLSPVISVLSLDLEYAEENILYDSDMELDLEASNWDPEPQMDTMTSDRKDPMVVDNWIQSHISQTEKGWYTATMQDSIPLPLPMVSSRSCETSPLDGTNETRWKAELLTRNITISMGDGMELYSRKTMQTCWIWIRLARV